MTDPQQPKRSLFVDDPVRWGQLMEGTDEVIPAELTKKYPTLHWCVGWDLLPVDEGMPEFECCLCFED